MSDLRTAAQQALEALQCCSGAVHWPVIAAAIKDLRTALEQPANEPVAWPDGLIDRIKAAEQRIQDGHALRRIPADPTDVDLVLAEVRYLLEGKQPPFWIKTAAQPQPKQEPVAWKHDCAALLQNDVELWIDQCPHCGKPATPQPQPKQEPVAWQPIETAPKDGSTVIIGRDMGDFGFVRGYGRFDGTEGEFCSGWISHGFSEYQGNLGLAHPTHWMPLPPAPDAAPHPQREWVGLTDGEWQDLSDKYGLIIFGRFKIEIEAKLREKNGGVK